MSGTQVVAVSRKVTVICLAYTNTYANGTGYLFANGIIYPSTKIFVQVVNLIQKQINVQTKTKI